MSQFSFTKRNTVNPPPLITLPILQELVASYKLWSTYFIHFEKHIKFGIGQKIDKLFIEIIQHVFIASNKPKEQKLLQLDKASDIFDTLKFLLQVLWELKKIEDKKYITLSLTFVEIGRMLGGWRKKTKTP